jgi:outer membrane protein OmpA-like peptidoglycan-associated protein
MKRTLLTLAAALAFGAPPAVLAQEDPNVIVVPDQQPAQQPEDVIKKKKKKHQSEQPAEQSGQQVTQPEEQPQPSAEGVEQPELSKKKKKSQEAQQPEDLTQPPEAGSAETQPEIVKRKKKQVEETQPEIVAPEAEPQQMTEPEQPVKKKKKPQVETTEQPVAPTEEPAQQTTEQPQTEQPTTAGIPPEVSRYLSDARPESELSDEELAERAKIGRKLIKMKGLSDDVRQELADKAKRARAEAMTREQAKAGKGGQPEQGQEATGQKGDQVPPVAEQPPTEVLPPPKTEEAVQPNPDKKQVEQLDGNKSSPEAEAKARTYLDDTRTADQLSDDQLRERLDSMRDLMAGNQLSRDSERALRRKLRAERDILRKRVATKVVTEESQDTQQQQPEWKRRDRDESKWEGWAENDILRDRRRSDQLEVGELRRRIDVYRIAIYDDRYDEVQRAYWRGMMDRDRLYLRERLLDDRRDRERYWRERRDRNDIDININIVLDQDREPPEAAFMDEIDDEELEDYLVAAPRRQIPRRYTVEEIEEEPEVRTAMPAIEIDNIHFGFNESFLREEEVEKLDRIAEVIEKILAAHPGERFMIEGNTDAVGSDAYNLNLSRERAVAVKKALTSYYVIPARNLVTVGYGERYLKIPTAEAEEENRRVAVRRATPLIGEADMAGD